MIPMKGEDCVRQAQHIESDVEKGQAFRRYLLERFYDISSSFAFHLYL